MLDSLINTLASRPWEALAVLLSLAYVIFAAREHWLCWPCALGATAIYTLLFWGVSLPMESALNFYYLIMALYGWWLWTKPGDKHEPAQIHSWPWINHLRAIAIVAVATCVSGYLLQTYRPSAALPYLDSFTTWASILTTWMVARKVLENWLYWVVIDAASIFLYLDRGMSLTAGLFCIYVVIAVYGWLGWRAKLHEFNSAATAG